MNGHDREDRTGPYNRGVGPALARLAVAGLLMLLFALPMLALVGAQVGSSGAGLPGWLTELPRILAGLMCWATALVAYLMHRASDLLRDRPIVTAAAYALSLAFSLIGTWLLAGALL